MRSDTPQTDYPKTKSKTLFGGVNCFLSLKNEGKEIPNIPLTFGIY